MARINVTLANEVGGNLQLAKGATVKAYRYDNGQPNNRGALLGTLTETPAASGQYVMSLAETEKIVVTADTGGGEANLAAWEGRKVWGETAGTPDVKDAAITTPKIPDESITGAKLATGALQVRHFTTDVVPPGAVDPDSFSASEFERIAGIIQLKSRGIAPEKIQLESLTGDELTDELLEARHFASDIIYAQAIDPSTFNADHFEHAGSPLAYQLKSNFINAMRLKILDVVFDYGADPTGASGSSQAFQDAFDDIAVLGDTAVVVIPPGTYRVRNLSIGANTVVFAYGAVVSLDSGVAAPVGVPTGSAWLIEATGNAGSEVENIKIVGGTWEGELTSGYSRAADGSLFNLTYCNQVIFQDAIFQRAKNNAAFLESCDFATFENCRFVTIAGSCVYLSGARHIKISKCSGEKFRYLSEQESSSSRDCEDISVVNNAFVVSNTGIEANDVKKIIIANNKFEAILESGLDQAGQVGRIIQIDSDSGNTAIAAGLEQIIIASNIFYNIDDPDDEFVTKVEINISKNGTHRNINIFGNQFYDCDLQIDFGAAVTSPISGILVHSNLMSFENISVIAIDARIESGKYTAIKENVINNSATGIRYNGNGATGQYAVITGNSISDCGTGILFNDCERIVAAGNLVGGCSTGVALDAQTVSCIVKGSIFQGNTTDISDNGTNNILTDNTVL